VLTKKYIIDLMNIAKSIPQERFYLAPVPFL
jgi:hypothetical protein